MPTDKLIPHTATRLIDELDDRYPAPTVFEILQGWNDPNMYGRLSQRMVIERLIEQRRAEQELPDV